MSVATVVRRPRPRQPSSPPLPLQLPFMLEHPPTSPSPATSARIARRLRFMAASSVLKDQTGVRDEDGSAGPGTGRRSGAIFPQELETGKRRRRGKKAHGESTRGLAPPVREEATEPVAPPCFDRWLGGW